MPLGFERLNERAQRPNSCINFIKPLISASPKDQKIAQNFLERIAAQCYPIMKKDYLSVMALEEYPPNREFLGRNFNAGEVIQLVLKDKSGRWLSFKFVQMVMMHELAHCKQMNHSRNFWNERNRFAAHMEELWVAGYKGEGLWGRGQDLTTGVFVPDRMPDDVDVPRHLCGGTYRTGRGRKRKRRRGQADVDKPKLTYAERQQKRIAKKFGIHGGGQSLGEDGLVRGALDGKRNYGKPRVAQSKRGRELRANAALARFEAASLQNKTPEVEDDDESDTESEGDEYADTPNKSATLEMIKDQQGRDLYKVCGDEGEQDEGGEREMDELRRIQGDFGGQRNRQEDNLPLAGRSGNGHDPSKGNDNNSETEGESGEEIPVSTHSRSPPAKLPPNKNRILHPSREDPTYDDSTTEGEDEEEETAAGAAVSTSKRKHPAMKPSSSSNAHIIETLVTATYTEPTSVPSPVASLEEKSSINACPICSLENEPLSTTCMACAHVLKPFIMRNHWRCKSTQCKGSNYLNAGDVGRCGLCGGQKPSIEATPMGVTNGEVLRWD